MSDPQLHAPRDDQHGHQDDHVDHGSVKTYAIGFILSVILTAIPFWLVMGNVFNNSGTTAFVILGFAGVQIVVHMIYFLHMNTKSEGGWSILALVFTVMVVVIMLVGSIWVMYHLNTNMMPHMSDPTGEMLMPSATSPAMPQMHHK